MCDTITALPEWSLTGSTIFAKNSDRSPNEPHLVIRQEAKTYEPGTRVKLTYIEIPQAGHTLECILLKPSWTWGAEMGVNSAGVAIGNEAVFTKAKRGEPALTGMDLVRLALESAGSAKDAVDVITMMLETYGQGGSCGFDHEFHYDNSFLIADPGEAYILETSAKRWVAKSVEKKGAISNRLTIRGEHTLRGGVDEGFDFAGKLTEPVFTHFSGSKQRLSHNACALQNPIDAAGAMLALRKHHPKDDGREFTHGSVRSVCMHAGGLVGDQTTGSVVVEIRRDRPSTLWVTGASVPCIAAFKPVFFGIDSGAPVFSDEAGAKQYWLKREHLHRAVLAGAVDIAALRASRDALEAEWIKKERELFASGAPDDSTLRTFAQQASQQEQHLIDEYMPRDAFAMPGGRRFHKYWEVKNAALE